MIHFHASLAQFVGFVIAASVFMGCGDDTNTNQPSSSSLGAGGAGGASSGSTSSGSGGDAGASQAWAGIPSGDPLVIQIQMGVDLASPPATIAYVEVGHLPTETQLDGVNVTVTPLGGAPITLSSTGDLAYKEVFQSDWVASYEFNVEHPLGSRKGIIVTPPSKFTIAIDPPPKANMPSTVTWTPFGDANFGAYVSVGSYSTPTATPLPDTGSYEVPGTAFAGLSGDLTLKVRRIRLDTVPNEVVASVIVDAAQSGIKLEP